LAGRVRLFETPAGGTTIAVWAVPGSSRDRVAGAHDGALKVRVSAPPEGGKANARVCEVIARTLEIRPSDVKLTSGTTSRSKTAEVAGLGPREVARRLGVEAVEEKR
jgi:uncharacterized protein (TIGR00251 family)